MKNSSTQKGIQPRYAPTCFSSESSESKIEAGLLARLTFAGLLSSEEPMAGICKSCFAAVQRNSNLQLRGQLRYCTGFPFNSKIRTVRVGNQNLNKWRPKRRVKKEGKPIFLRVPSSRLPCTKISPRPACICFRVTTNSYPTGLPVCCVWDGCCCYFPAEKRKPKISSKNQFP